MHCGKQCVWRNDGQERKRWRCNTCKIGIAARKDSLFANSALSIRTLIMLMCYWLGDATIAQASAATAVAQKTVTLFSLKMRKVCNDWMKLNPFTFNRSPVAIEGIGRCKDGCSIFIMVSSGGDTLMLHDRAHQGGCIGSHRGRFCRCFPTQILFLRITMPICFLLDATTHLWMVARSTGRRRCKLLGCSLSVRELFYVTGLNKVHIGISERSVHR